MERGQDATRGVIHPGISLGKLADVLLGKLVREVNRQFVSGENIETILKFIDRSLPMIIPYDRMAVGLIENGFVVLSWTNFPGISGFFRHEESVSINESYLQEILETGRPGIVSDLPTFSSLHPDLKISKLAVQQGLQSSLTCPLKNKGRSIGMVIFFSFSPDAYKEDHVDTFHEISEQLSAVVVAGWPDNDLHNAETLRMVLHDLRNPLGIIQSLIDLYTQTGALDPKISETLRRNTRFMFGILDDLTELDQLNNRSDAIKKRAVQLKEFTSEIVRNARLLSEAKKIDVIDHINRSIPKTAMFDAVKIRRAIDNLISNALKFSDQGTQVAISAWSSPGRLYFSVKDHGRGIPANEFSKLFKEFGKTSVRPTEGEKSTGLGLIIAKRIVEQHGGNLSFISTVGQGSTFEFWLPIS